MRRFGSRCFFGVGHAIGAQDAAKRYHAPEVAKVGPAHYRQHVQLGLRHVAQGRIERLIDVQVRKVLDGERIAGIVGGQDLGQGPVTVPLRHMLMQLSQGRHAQQAVFAHNRGGIALFVQRPGRVRHRGTAGKNVLGGSHGGPDDGHPLAVPCSRGQVNAILVLKSFVDRFPLQAAMRCKS